jgi:hypothetical protein
MNQLEVEECPVCWRAFSTELVPITIVCGHSFCQECSVDLKKCPLCRRRLQTGYNRATNYSLLSLVNRIEQVGKKETRDQEVQTETQARPYKPRSGPRIEPSAPALAMSAIVKLTRVQQMLAKSFSLNSNFQ